MPAKTYSDRSFRHLPAIAFCCFIFFQPFYLQSQSQVPPIGEWRDHLNYQQAFQIVQGDQLYCAVSDALFAIDAQDNITRYNKTTGLSDVPIACIGWDAGQQQLLIAYTNSNLDFLRGSSVSNLPDIARSSFPGNKSIQSIYCNNGFAYLGTGLGIIVINLVKQEVRDTWVIGANGLQTPVHACISDGNTLYAATDEGLKSIALSDPLPANFLHWQNISLSSALGAGPVNNIFALNQQLIARKNDSLWIQSANQWHLLYADTAWPIIEAAASAGKITVCQRKSNGASRVIILNPSGLIEKTIAQSNVISYPRMALLSGGDTWVADQYGGLARFNSTVTRFIPNGPPGTADGDLLAANGSIYAAAGSVNASWNYQYNRNGLYFFQHDSWMYKNAANTPLLDSVLDFISLAFNKADSSLWAGSYGGGLLRLDQQGNIQLFKQNSSLQPAIGDAGSYRVSGLAFDEQGNLWISNYGAAQDLQLHKPDGSWIAIPIPFSHTENAIGQIVIDDQQQLWIQSPKGNGVFCYNPGKQADNLQDDQWKYFRAGSGSGNLPINNVLCLVKDKDGFIWVGTDQGIGIITCTNSPFSNSCEASLPVVQQDQFAGYLFRDEVVQCMAVDGANRKWVGTKNGVWLISADGQQIIYRFSAENSPLLSDDIRKIAIDPNSGEVFLATSNGICSFRSTATAPVVNPDKNTVLVFPNPVPPGYQGTIAIRGLADNSLVKITDLSGRLVFQTRSLGGQAVWNGKNYLGHIIASGVYLVVVRDDAGNEKIATKVVIASN
ncbi:MAG TPA: two-component regulator propeller domain-containing protein [Sediminibacterium sp.]|nr:two-component regulator propeller domain-containing protein [Sediminibacterium sp.]